MKEPTKFHIYETEKISRKASYAAEYNQYIKLFGSFTRDRHARRINVILWTTADICVVVVPKMHRIWDIRLQKCCDLENRVMGPSRSLEMSPCDRAHMTSYCRSIVTMALSHVVSEIFNVEKCGDIEIGVRGHLRSLKEVPFYRLWVWFPISVL